MERVLWILAGGYGFAGVALGAFGAHALRPLFAQAADPAKCAEWWHTATEYHLVHALAIGLTAALFRRGESRAAAVAGCAFAAGVLVFSGSLELMATTGTLWLGAVTPIGGVLLLVGWAALVVGAAKLRA